MGVRAAVLDTTSVTPAAPVAPVAPGASSKNPDLIAIRVTSELATSSDIFVLCAGCGLGEGRGAPVQAGAPPKQLSMEKHICSGTLFSRFLPVGQILSLYVVLESMDPTQKPVKFLSAPNPIQSAPGEPREPPDSQRSSQKISQSLRKSAEASPESSHICTNSRSTAQAADML